MIKYNILANLAPDFHLELNKKDIINNTFFIDNKII